MKGRGRAPAALVLVLALVLALSGCAGEEKPEIDAAAYVKGQLDECYLGQFDPAFLTLVNITEETAEGNYQRKMEEEAYVFINTFGIEYPEETLTDQLAELYKLVYAKADYTVSPAALRQTDGSYLVEVTVRPLDVMRRMYAAFPFAHAGFESRFSDVDTEDMSDEEYTEWNKTVFDPAYAERMTRLFSSLAEKAAPMEAQTLTVRVEQDAEEGYYTINSEDLAAVDKRIIEYAPQEEAAETPPLLEKEPGAAEE